VAIGGITLTRAPEIIESGADSVAVISDILGAPEPGMRAKQYIDLLGPANPRGCRLRQFDEWQTQRILSRTPGQSQSRALCVPSACLTHDDRRGLDDWIGHFHCGFRHCAADGSPGGLLLTWVLTGLLTISAALSYGELAALFPHAGGQYVYLREAYSPLWGFLYGWTLFLVIQTGTIRCGGGGFAKYLGVLLPAISPQAWIVHPISLGSKYAISLSVQQLVAS